MRAVVTGMVVLAALLVMPGTASAQWRWLEKLSGPGPFVLTQFEQKLWCGYERDGSSESPQYQANLVNAVLSAPCIEFTEDADLSPLKRKWAIGVGGGLGVSLANGLSYEDGLTTAQTRVYVVPLEAFAELNPCALADSPSQTREKLARRLCRRFDIAGVVGVHTFFGLGLRHVVPATHHLAYGARASFALMTFGTPQETLRGAVRLRLGWMKYPDGFDARDFGAIPGSWQVQEEWVRSWSLVVDLDRLR